MSNQDAAKAIYKLNGATRRIFLMCVALVVFSIQFLLPWDASSWHRFWRSIGAGVFVIAALSALFRGARFVNPPDTVSGETERFRDLRWTRNFVLAFMAIGALALLVYSMQFLLPEASDLREGLSLFGAGGLVALASLMAGALVGFIFGIPRFLRERQIGLTPTKSTPAEHLPLSSISRTRPVTEETSQGESRAAATRFQGNTNLEEISDWLTKIIVGVGLTKLANIPDYVKRLTVFVTYSIGSKHPQFSESIAFSLMVAFSICGFFMGYLMTRLFLPRALDEAENQAKWAVEVGQAAGDPVSKEAIPDAAVLGSSIQRALSVLRASEGVSESVIRDQVRKLAKKYESLRLSMSSGEERTNLMEQVAAQMKSLGLAVRPFLNDLKNSDDAGERLAAVTSLEIKPQEESLDWLGERVDVERPFVGYHAALALLSAARAFTPPSRSAPDSASQTGSVAPNGPHDHLCDAIKRAMKALEDKGLTETDRHDVLSTARNEAMCK